RHASSERDLVDAALDERGAGLAVTLDYRKYAGRQARRFEEFFHESAGPRRYFRGFHDDRVAGHQGLNARVERKDERPIPWRDDAHDAQRLIGDDEPLRLEQVQADSSVAKQALRVPCEVGEGVASGKDLHDDRLDARATGLGSDHLYEALLIAE